ncbi:MAG: carbon dioxide concentrating mechanism protein CcmL [Oscillospiraceae bacterium]|nr:carbon dioxide concentrating mechanism protein CcmL [Oscillospiraceae bacterium]
MRMGIVTGSVWATRKAECLQRQTFLTVDIGEGNIVASDQVGAGVGDRVLVVLGRTAAQYCMEAPVDAAIVAILDKKEGA